MKRYIPLLLFSAAIGCSGQPTTTTEIIAENAPSAPAMPLGEVVPTVSTDDAAASVYVIDVRSKREWDSGHVEQAVHIPHTEIADRISEVTDDKNAKIVLYCAVGGRAGQAKSKLEELGFTNVENAGGYDDVKDRF